jgi:hypothetical protein
MLMAMAFGRTCGSPAFAVFTIAVAKRRMIEKIFRVFMVSVF